MMEVRCDLRNDCSRLECFEGMESSEGAKIGECQRNDDYAGRMSTHLEPFKNLRCVSEFDVATRVGRSR